MKLNIFIDLLQRIMKDINRKGLIDAVKIYLLKIDNRIFDYKYNLHYNRNFQNTFSVPVAIETMV